MEQVYFWCAAIAGSIFALQSLLTFVGIGAAEVDLPDVDLPDVDLDVGDIDIDGPEVDHGSGSSDTHFVGMLSLKAIIAGATVFGLTGMAAGRQLDAGRTVFIAMAAAAATMYAVAWLIHKMHQLNADGTVQVSECIGTVGSVYLKIPGDKTGLGKVTVEVQGRTMEYSALTEGAPIKTGAKVRIQGIADSDTLIVQAV